jgi:hypothetical protein
MATHVDTQECEAVLVEDAHIRPMMGLDILEPLPSPRISGWPAVEGRGSTWGGRFTNPSGSPRRGDDRILRVS